MASEMAFRVAFLVCLAMYMAKPSCGQVFDVTDYGAVADGKTDNSKAFLDAWNVACTSEGDATFRIPKGTFVVGPVTFEGPCYNDLTMNVEIQGNIKAVTNIDVYPQDVWIDFRAVRGLVISGAGTIDGQGAVEAWSSNKCRHKRRCKNMPTSLRLSGVTDTTVSGLTLINSMGFHMKVQRSAFVAVDHLNISAPEDSPNTDGIHISGTNHINLTSLTIGTGDDCISIGPGSISVSISDVTCGPGHGISIGSLGKYKDEKDVSLVKVRNCTLTDTDNGIRIKTWPASPPSVASHFTFEDIVMNNVTNPIIIDQLYCPPHNCDKKPSRVRIHDVTFKSIRGTTDDAVPVSLVCSDSVPCEGVHLEDIHLERISATGNTTITAACSNVKGLVQGIQIPKPCL